MLGGSVRRIKCGKQAAKKSCLPLTAKTLNAHSCEMVHAIAILRFSMQDKPFINNVGIFSSIVAISRHSFLLRTPTVMSEKPGAKTLILSQGCHVFPVQPPISAPAYFSDPSVPFPYAQSSISKPAHSELSRLLELYSRKHCYRWQSDWRT